MKLRILAHRTYSGAQKMLLTRLSDADERNLNELRIVIVPERVSFAAESRLTESLDATFTSIYTFRRFADLVLPKSDFLSKASSIIALTGIVAKNRDRLACYKKGVDSYGFVSSLYEIISRLKYSLVKPRELTENDPPSYLKAKLADISLLYGEYEEFTRKKLNDASDRLNSLLKSLPNVEWLERTHFYFLDFDNFSAQESEIIKELIKRSASVNISCAYSDARPALYPNEVFTRVIEISKGLVAPEIMIESRLDDESEFIAANLFGFSLNATERRAGRVSLYEASGVEDEIESLARHIISGVVKGARYDDFSVVVSSESYYPGVARVFGRYGVPCYINRKFTLSEHCLGRYISDFFKIYKNNYALSDVVPFVKNFLFDAGADAFAFERYTQKFNISHDFSAPFAYACVEKDSAERVRERLVTLLPPNKLLRQDLAEGYTRKIRELIESSYDVLERYTRLETDPVSAAFTRQVRPKLIELVGQIERILSGISFTIEEFSRLLDASMSAVLLSVIPQQKHCVSVVPLENARQISTKFLCVIGAGEGAFPQTVGDFGLLDDKSISLLKELNVKIEPSVRMLNKRARFNVFQLLLEPCDSLYLSCPDRGAASAVFKQMQRIFLPREREKSFYSARYSAEYRLLHETARGGEDCSPLYYALDKPEITVDCGIKNIDCGKAVLLPQGTVSVSRIETFNSCQYKHFLQFGMRLKEVERFELDPRRFGTLLHEILERYFSALILDETIYSESIEAHNRRISGIYSEITSDSSYAAYLKNPAMKAFLGRLAIEAAEAAHIMREFIKESDFKPAYTEYEFGANKDFCLGDFFLRGKIDRIDVFKDMALILDYKSSGKEFSDAKFKAGLSLQLVTYIIALQRLRLRCVGFYYAGISEKNQKGAVAFSGKSLGDNNVLASIDRNFLNGGSKRLGVQIKKDGTFTKYSKILTQDEFDSYVLVAREKIISAAAQMESGSISPSPYEKVCETCPYGCVCGFTDTIAGKPKKLYSAPDSEAGASDD